MTDFSTRRPSYSLSARIRKMRRQHSVQERRFAVEVAAVTVPLADAVAAALASGGGDAAWEDLTVALEADALRRDGRIFAGDASHFGSLLDLLARSVGAGSVPACRAAAGLFAVASAAAVLPSDSNYYGPSAAGGRVAETRALRVLTGPLLYAAGSGPAQTALGRASPLVLALEPAEAATWYRMVRDVLPAAFAAAVAAGDEQAQGDALWAWGEAARNVRARGDVPGASLFCSHVALPHVTFLMNSGGRETEAGAAWALAHETACDDDAAVDLLTQHGGDLADALVGHAGDHPAYTGETGALLPILRCVGNALSVAEARGDGAIAVRFLDDPAARATLMRLIGMPPSPRHPLAEEAAWAAGTAWRLGDATGRPVVGGDAARALLTALSGPVSHAARVEVLAALAHSLAVPPPQEVEAAIIASYSEVVPALADVLRAAADGSCVANALEVLRIMHVCLWEGGGLGPAFRKSCAESELGCVLNQVCDGNVGGDEALEVAADMIDEYYAEDCENEVEIEAITPVVGATFTFGLPTQEREAQLDILGVGRGRGRGAVVPAWMTGQ